MNKEILKVEQLSHRYSKDWAVKDLSFSVHGRGILGLLGSNGAGKSTTMNIVCGVLKQTAGKVTIGGIDLEKEPIEAKKKLGFLPQTAPLHLDFTVDEYLIHCAHLRLMDKETIAPALKLAKEQCGIAHFSKRLIKNLSGGYRQRVGIAQAIIHKPELVVLDEPTNGLDPNQIMEVRGLIKEIAKEHAVIFSSHILSEIQATCKDIIMIEAGRVVFSDTMEAFYNYIEADSMVVSMNDRPDKEKFLAIEGITAVEFLNDKDCRLKFKNTPGISERVVEASVQNGWHLQELVLEKSSMDEVFARLSKKTKPKEL